MALYTCPFRYLDESYRDEPEAGGSEPVAGGARTDSVPVPVEVHNGRNDFDHCRALEERGFGLARLSGPELANVQRLDPGGIAAGDSPEKRAYYRELEGLAARVTGADFVRATNAVVRRSSIVGVHTKKLGDYSARGPVNDVHCDFTPTAPAIPLFERLAEKLGLAGCRFEVINCWKNVADDPVQCWPMAVLDASTVKSTDLVPRVSPENGNQIYNVVASPRHRWFTYPRMTPDEVLMFKQFDSDPARVRFCPHTAFDAPDTLPTAPPRRSVEIRAICFFDEDGSHSDAIQNLRARAAGGARL